MIKIGTFFLIYLFLPGLILKLLFFRKDENISSLSWIPLIFIFSIIIFNLYSLSAYIFHFSHKLVFCLVISTSFVSIILLLFCSPKNRKKLFKKDKFSIFAILTFLLTGCIILFLAYYGAALHGDALGFLGIIRKIAGSSKIYNYAAFYKESQFDVTYFNNPWFLLISNVIYMTKEDLIKVWLILPIFLAPLMILSIYSAGKTIFNSTKGGWLSAIVFILIYGISEGMWPMRTSNFPQVLNYFIFFPASLNLSFLYLKYRKPRYMIFASLIGFTMFFLHPVGILIFSISLGSFAVGIFLLKSNKEDAKLILFILIITFILLLPHILYRLPTIKFNNYFYKILRAEDKVILSKNLFYLNPARLFAPHYLVEPEFPVKKIYKFYPRISYIFAFLVLFPLLLKYLKKDDSAVFIFSNMITVPFVVLNPILLFFLKYIIPLQILNEFTQISPVVFIYAFFLLKILQKMDNYMKPKNSEMVLFSFLFFIFLFPIFNRNLVWRLSHEPYPITFDSQNAVIRPEYPIYGFKINPVLSYMSKNISPLSVILANKELSLIVPAFCNNYVAVTYVGHVSAIVKDQNLREKVIKTVLNSTNIEEIKRALAKYKVKYILLYIEETNEKDFRKNKDVFKQIYYDNNFVIFKVKKY